MLNILVANSIDDSMQNILAAFNQHIDIKVTVARTGTQALNNISYRTFHLVVIAKKLEDISGLELAEKIVKINPMINCATASDLTPEDFHEASEGLGILMQLPMCPKKEHGIALLKRVQEISNLLNKDSNPLIQTSGKE